MNQEAHFQCLSPKLLNSNNFVLVGTSENTITLATSEGGFTVGNTITVDADTLKELTLHKYGCEEEVLALGSTCLLEAIGGFDNDGDDNVDKTENITNLVSFGGIPGTWNLADSGEEKLLQISSHGSAEIIAFYNGVSSTSISLQTFNPENPNNTVHLGVNASNQSPGLGETVNFTYELNNTTDGKLNNVSVTHTFDNTILEFSGKTEEHDSDEFTCSASGNTLECFLEELPSETKTLEVSFETKALGTSENTITLATSEGGFTVGNTITVDADTLTNITIASSCQNGSIVSIGDECTFSAEGTFTGAGSQDITDIVTFVNIPSSWTLASSEGDLPVRYVVNGHAITDIKAAYKNIISTNSIQLKTFNPENPGYVVFLGASPSNASPGLGEEVTYAYTVQNNTADEVQDIQVRHVFDTSLLELVAVTASAPVSCPTQGSTLECFVSKIPASDTVTFEATFVTKALGTGRNAFELTYGANESFTLTNEITIDTDNLVSIDLSQSSCGTEILIPGQQCTLVASGRYSNLDLDLDNDGIPNNADSTPQAGVQNGTDSDGDGINDLSDVDLGGTDTDGDGINDMNDIDLADLDLDNDGIPNNADSTPQAGVQNGTDTDGDGINDLSDVDLGGTDTDGDGINDMNDIDLEQIIVRDITEEVSFFVPQELGTITEQEGLETRIFTASAPGIATILAEYSEQRASISQRIISEFSVSLTEAGDSLRTFAVRTSGNPLAPTIIPELLTPADEQADLLNVVSRTDSLQFEPIGQVGNVIWTLEDPTSGTLEDPEEIADCTSGSCTTSGPIQFTAAASERQIVLRATLESDARFELALTIHILPPAPSELRVVDDQGAAFTAPQEINLNESFSYFAEEKVDGVFASVAPGTLLWEFSYDGADFTSSSDKGTITAGIFEPLEAGVFRLRVKKEIPIASPGQTTLTQVSEELVSDPVTINVQDAIPVIQSLQLIGNAGVGKGTSDEILTRIRHFSEIDAIQEIQLELLPGTFATFSDISDSDQRFTLTVTDNPGAERTGQNSALLQIPFRVPELADIDDGPHTLLLSLINRNDARGDEEVHGILGTYVGEPVAGDVDLDGTFGEADLVLLADSAVSGSLSALQRRVADANGDGEVTIQDFYILSDQLLELFLTNP